MRFKNGLSRSEKILLVLYNISKGTTKKIRFEDIAVGAFKKYKSDFQLRGYPNYPDSGDIIHKPLYSDLKKKGLVLSGGKYFSLTKKGIEFCKDLKKMDSAKKIGPDKLTRSAEQELNNIVHSTAFELFISGRKDQILDIDFYSYLGTSVRTKKFDFFGRLSSVEDAIEASKQSNAKLYNNLKQLHEYMLVKFKDIVDYFKNMKGGA